MSVSTTGHDAGIVLTIAGVALFAAWIGASRALGHATARRRFMT